MTADAASDVSFGVLYGLFWVTANIAADGPLLLLIDDLHWCDQASLRFVAYLERRLEGLQVLVAAAARTSEQPSDSRLLAEIADDPVAVSVHPSELSEGAVAELVRGRLGADAEQPFCAACHEATGGNPLLVRELLKTLQAEDVRPDRAHADAIREVGPRAVSRTVLLRLARLPPDAVPVARAVAVLGDGAGLPAVATVAQTEEHRVAVAARALAGAEILRPEPPLGFVHPLVRDAVYHDLAAAERELLHERAAKTLVDLGAAPELVAAQLLAAPSRAEPWVVTLLREAALAARRRGATESAVLYLRRALEEPPPAEQREQLLLELGLAEGLVNAPAAVAAHQPGARSARRSTGARAGRRDAGEDAALHGPAAGGRYGRTGRAGRAPGRAPRRAPGARGARAVHRRVRRAGAGCRRAARARARRRASRRGWPAACSAALPLGTGRCGAAPHRSALSSHSRCSPTAG